MLALGKTTFNCAVLDNEDRTRVISERSISEALGTSRGGTEYKKREKMQVFSGGNIPIYLASPNLIPYISKDLKEAFDNPFKYLPPGKSPLKPALGIKATSLPMVCEVFLKAKDAGVLKSQSQ